MREQVCLINFQILISTIKESGLGGDRACNVNMAAFKKATTRARYRKADTVSRSTQTEPSANSNIPTPTGDNEDEAAEQDAPMKTSASGRDSRIIRSADGIPGDAADYQTSCATVEERMSSEEPQWESKLRESITDGDFHDLYHGLPKVVVDCVRAVFSAVAEFPRFAPVEPCGEAINGGERSEGAEDLWIENEPESPEVGEVFGVPLPVYLPGMENIEKTFWEELDGGTSCQEELIDDVFLPDVTEPAVLDEADANRDEVAAAGALAFHRSRQPATVGKVSTELINTEGFPEDAMTKLGLETGQEGQQRGVAAQSNAADALQAAMEAVSHELSAIVSLEADEVEADEAVKEEEIVEAAFEPLSEQSHGDLFIPKVTHLSVFHEKMLHPPMDLIENKQIPNEDSLTTDFGSHDVKTSAEFLNGNDVNTEAAGIKTFTETKPCHAIATSNAEKKTGGVPHVFCSTSTSEWKLTVQRRQTSRKIFLYSKL